MAALDRVEGLISAPLEAMGFEVVRIRLGSGRRPQLQVMAERKGGGTMTLDDCAAISRAISAVLDVADPISSAYDLEVSSPGIDRPLVKLDDFRRFAGEVAKIELARPFGVEGGHGRKRFRGRLAGVAGDAEAGETVRIETEDGEVALAWADIIEAKLVLTDELMAKELKAAELKAAELKARSAK
jgi:ribosome maturation factor RimP